MERLHERRVDRINDWPALERGQNGVEYRFVVELYCFDRTVWLVGIH